MLQGDKVDAAVLEIGTGLEVAWTSGDVVHQTVRTGAAILRLQFCYWRIGRQTGSVCQQVLHANGYLTLSVFALPILELGDVEVYRVLQAQTSLLNQYHGTDGCAHGFTA